MINIRKIFKYLKIIKNKVNRLIQKIIQKITEGFLFETWIYSLSNVAKTFYILDLMKFIMEIEIWKDILTLWFVFWCELLLFVNF